MLSDTAVGPCGHRLLHLLSECSPVEDYHGIRIGTINSVALNQQQQRAGPTRIAISALELRLRLSLITFN